MIVHVLLEENDEKSSFCHGVYANFEDAKRAKYTMIRDEYHIPENEVADKDLDDENDGQPDEAQEWHDFDPDC